MKKVYSLLLTVTITTLSLFAQAPQKMSYQAVIRDSENQLVVNTEIGMQISILQGSADGTAVYIEIQTPTTNANGLVSIEIGGDDPTAISGNFASIDWSDNPYFIKTETDPSGGTNYTITGTSQLLGVPYALHSGSSEVLTGEITESQISDLQAYLLDIGGEKIGSLSDVDLTGIASGKVLKYDTDQEKWVIADDLGLTEETDPLFEASPAAGIEDTNIDNWDEAYSWGDHAVEGYLTEETDPSVPSGTQTGEMQYWDGSEWITVSPGTDGQVLAFISGVPTWVAIEAAIGSPTDVYNPTTGKMWMDRNLGAKQAATSSTDVAAYGDLYQWGRATDGHQLRRSETTETLSGSDTPGHGNFIVAPEQPNDWRYPQNDNLWQGINGINNPCPAGYRLPTDAELEAEMLSWSSYNAAGAFDSPLKLPVAGYRHFVDGSLDEVGSFGYYWSGTVFGVASRILFFYSTNALMSSIRRASGLSVRCIKD